MNNDKVVIITGANSGIGKEATRKFAQEGYTVVMACRNMEISKLVQQELMQETNNEQIKLMNVDMSSFQSIQQFCLQFKMLYNKLDILIHNAAYFNHGEKYRLSTNNIELTFATNVFGPFLMTTLLKDHLKQSTDPRILHASSNIVKHFFDSKKKIEFDKIVGNKIDKKNHSVYKMYCQSKMALVLLTFKMAEEYKADGISIHALQINGAKMSKATLNKVTLKWRTIAYVQNVFFPPPKKMADLYYHICTLNESKMTTGQLFNDKGESMIPAPKNPTFIDEVKQFSGSTYYPHYAASKENQEKIWDLCAEITKDYRAKEILC
ncbi:SDR family NAD(P)-dependent oxidoreductase [Evansella sp. AB-P1]|uniref:SDR family NAD(P)-dependent oxidoreductase n=1 Tax=Evansella sp. AB-P1 TaxID=3037653 RepID=UPI0024200A49|nr:SDR family NAD(P)-dependent oxidoreductase [Evansella sp. AB-P1]MDG5787171.1 SDR family NAD(P)-dependent oxidoreductase [Evansella sp. AB-P1]